MGRRLQNSTERSGVWGVKGSGYWDKNLGIERHIGQTFPQWDLKLSLLQQLSFIGHSRNNSTSFEYGAP